MTKDVFEELSETHNVLKRVVNVLSVTGQKETGKRQNSSIRIASVKFSVPTAWEFNTASLWETALTRKLIISNSVNTRYL